MKRFFELINRNLFVYFKKVSKTQDILPLITIAREKGSGGRPIAYLIAEKLGKPWKVYHKEIVEQIAKETDLKKELIREVDEKKISFIDQMIADFFGKKYLNLASYHKHLLKVLSTIAQRGNAIVVGRGGQILFRNAFKVAISADRQQRIEWIVRYEKVSKNEAVRRIEKSDAERLEFVKAVYNKDPRDMHLYDLVIKTGENMSIEEAADLIVKEAKRRFKI